MKVVLISLYGVENIGIRVISSVLKKERFQVSTIYLKKWVNNNIHPPTQVEIRHLLNTLKNIKPALIGISLGSPYFNIAKKLTEQIKQEFLDVFIVWGGIHPTIVPEECIKNTDIVCVGEGEYPMLELAQAISGGKKVEDIRNLWVRKDEKIKKNPLRPLIQDLDKLPFPDLENDNKYYIEGNKLFQGDYLHKTAEYRIMASRGCPFNCSYCYNSTLRKVYKDKGKYLRQRSAENVVKELEYALERMPGLRKIKFDDDTFYFPKMWIKTFCTLYKTKVCFPFEILMNPSLIDKSILWELKNAGLRGVQIGIQGGSEKEVEENYNRALEEKQIVEFAEYNKSLKLDVVYDIILDNPLSTREDKESLLEFLIQLPRPFKLFLYSLTIFPKTEMAEKLVNLGLITKKDIEGEAVKSFKQFRLSLNYPRSKEDDFYISLLLLVSKSFIPKNLIRLFKKSNFFRHNPYFLKLFGYICNLVRIVWIAFIMLIRGELTVLKIKEYANLKLLLVQ